MPLLIDRDGPFEERWQILGEDAPLPPEGPVLVPLARLDEALARAHTAGEIGVHVPNDTDPDRLAPHFPRLALVSIAFPSFADGRGLSLGRALRLRGYRGRLRATGHLIADQFGQLLALGFDEVAVDDAVAARQPLEHWLAARERITLAYQRGLAHRRAIPEARRATHG